MLLFDDTTLNLENQKDLELLSALIADTKAIYQPILREAKEEESANLEITDTLTSKILLGVYGVTPAYDRYCREAVRLHGISGQFDDRSFKQVQAFYTQYEEEFSGFIEETAQVKLRYTPMKVIDMYFWKVAEIVSQAKDASMIERLINFSSDFRMRDSIRPVSIQKTLTLTSSNQTEDIRKFITDILLDEKKSGEATVDIVARDIHVAINLKNNYPSVCSAMASLPLFKNYKVVYEPPSGKSSTVTYRYELN